MENLLKVDLFTKADGELGKVPNATKTKGFKAQLGNQLAPVLDELGFVQEGTGFKKLVVEDIYTKKQFQLVVEIKFSELKENTKKVKPNKVEGSVPKLF